MSNGPQNTKDNLLSPVVGGIDQYGYLFPGSHGWLIGRENEIVGIVIFRQDTSDTSGVGNDFAAIFGKRGDAAPFRLKSLSWLLCQQCRAVQVGIIQEGQQLGRCRKGHGRCRKGHARFPFRQADHAARMTTLRSHFVARREFARDTRGQYLKPLVVLRSAP